MSEGSNRLAAYKKRMYRRTKYIGRSPAGRALCRHNIFRVGHISWAGRAGGTTLTFVKLHGQQPADNSSTSCSGLCGKAVKIFAKIEWKDTSKNPTAGSKNNSLSE